MAKRRNFSAAFKAKVALEALKGEETLAALSARDKVQCGHLGRHELTKFRSRP